ncbi:unnamed protein product [Penicillium roqueforti FM164]|uniref:Str. FM013 n=2 Tax=Penicillium TaxID=5073 RepID=A0A0G4PYJ4_PENC3|nr:unnamed protein product [Penicillium roqueforti FM164]CRL31404.1 unnamed protein product [Penicillium camemberti]
MAKTFPTQVRRALVGGKLDDSSAVHLFTPQAHASHPGLNNRYPTRGN